MHEFLRLQNVVIELLIILREIELRQVSMGKGGSDRPSGLQKGPWNVEGWSLLK
jgi:hypothetical protein